jgi:Reverse transcriptase (RNA-dependent DNA polymerase)
MMDVKGAYLNLNLEEEIYMQQPDGFDDGMGHVLKLCRALYGPVHYIIRAGALDHGETCAQVPTGIA